MITCGPHTKDNYWNVQWAASSRLRFSRAIAGLEKAADYIGATAFSLDRKGLSDEEELLRDYYFRLSPSLHDTLQELRVIAAKRHH